MGDMSEETPRCVFFVSGSNIQNSVLRDLVAKQVGVSCRLTEFVSEKRIDPALAQDNLFLVDCSDASAEALSTELDVLSGLNNGARTIRVAGVNVDAAAENFLLDNYFVWPQLRGVFRGDCSLDRLCHGIEAIFAGGHWVPRRFFDAVVDRVRPSIRVHCTNNGTLTRKEFQVLNMLANGDSNVRIARNLNISEHTVKSHIYKVYKKLKVGNRVEAVNWLRERQI